MLHPTPYTLNPAHYDHHPRYDGVRGQIHLVPPAHGGDWDVKIFSRHDQP